MARQFVTGNALFAGRYALCISFPKSQENWVMATFMGLLEEMQHPWIWRSGGETTIDEAQAIFKDIYDRVQPLMFLIGSIMPHAGALLDSATGWLLCDGSRYAQADYADLFAVIGTTYNQGGDPGDSFRVPDLRGRMVAGVDATGRLPAWAANRGGTGGEKEHTLTEGEIPSHSHSTGNSLTGAAVMPGEGPVLIPNPIPASTGSTGGGGAHNNIQPTMTLYYYILATL